MSTTHDIPRSNRNPILRSFRRDTHSWDTVTHGDRVEYATDWAQILTAKDVARSLWTQGATVSQQVFAARVLYRYAAVFA